MIHKNSDPGPLIVLIVKYLYVYKEIKYCLNQKFKLIIIMSILSNLIGWREFYIFTQALIRECKQKNIFLISQTKGMLCVLRKNISKRWFFEHPK